MVVQKHAPNDIVSKQLEEAAKADRKGLWMDPNPSASRHEQGGCYRLSGAYYDRPKLREKIFQGKAEVVSVLFPP
jgi:hypothetical protein